MAKKAKKEKRKKGKKDGIRSEFKQVRWPKRKEMFKYSLAVVICIIVFALFFLLSDVIIAGIGTLVEG